jgi:hypothetical protein
MGINVQGSQPSDFYFGYVAVFEVETGAPALRHASISVFHDVCAGELLPLFRAEWDRQAACDVGSQHAQPHWHFVLSPKRIEGIVRSLTSRSGEFSPDPPTEIFGGLADCGRVHFAMTSMLNDADAPGHKQVFGAEQFEVWFSNVTRYIAGQVAYIVEKLPSGRIREFIPEQR